MKDKSKRSLAKAVSWRTVGTIDPTMVSFFITREAAMAVSIGASEVMTKIFLYYLHERVWNKVHWGRKSEGPNHLRSIIKSVSWRVTGTMDTIFLAFLFSGDILKSLSIGGTEVVTKILLYYLHERLWARIRWGRDGMKGSFPAVRKFSPLLPPRRSVRTKSSLDCMNTPGC